LANSIQGRTACQGLLTDPEEEKKAFGKGWLDAWRVLGLACTAGKG
jgi:hypothetical protein